MWCSGCQTDVLPVGSTRGDSATECMHCKQVFRIHRQPRGHLSEGSLWLQPVEQSGLLTGMPLRLNAGEKILREDAAHHGSFHSNVRKSDTPRRRTSICVWFALTVGLAAMTCGIVLTGWSTIIGIDRFWNFGIPIAASGLALFLAGIALQLDWISSQARVALNLLERRSKSSDDRENERSRKNTLTQQRADEPARAMHDLTDRLKNFATRLPQDI